MKSKRVFDLIIWLVVKEIVSHEPQSFFSGRVSGTSRKFSAGAQTPMQTHTAAAPV